MINGDDLIRIATEQGADQAAILKTSDIQFHEDFRKACEKNACGKYDTNWMGPPAVGPISLLKERVLRFPQGILFQTTHPVASNFDMKGMSAAAVVHNDIFRVILGKIREAYPEAETLPLDAGCCSVCEKCAYVDGIPCRNPDLAVSSVEAYGINVIALQKTTGIPCFYDKTTVCFVGLILFLIRNEEMPEKNNLF
jgi:predicted metal-binding protein